METPMVYVLGRLITDIYANEVGLSLQKVKSFNRYLGGSAGNTAVGLVRHGASVGLISRVGSDQHGAFLLDVLDAEGVNHDMVNMDLAHATGLAFAALKPPSDSEVLFYCDDCAYQHLEIDDLNTDALTTARILAVGGTTLATSPSREATLFALKTNRAAGGLNVLDVDWRPIFWPDKREANLYYEMALQLSDVVLANESELEFVSGRIDPNEAAKALRSFGVTEVVAKRGGAGVLYFGPEGETSAPAFRVDVLNTLGAGDAFGAAYIYGLMQDWPVERRLEYACAAAAIVVSRHSCSDAMPTRAETEAFILAQSPEVKERG